MPEAKSLVSQEEMARIFKENREKTTFIMDLENGIYRLLVDIKNTQADKRVKNDWRCSPIIENGTRFVVRQDEHKDCDFSDEFKQDYTYRETVMFPVGTYGVSSKRVNKRYIEANRMVQFLEKEPVSLAQHLFLANPDDWHGFNQAVIILLSDSSMPGITVEEAIKAVKDMPTEDIQVLRCKHGFVG